MLTRGTIDAATARRPLSSLLALTVQLEAVMEVGLLGRHCPRLRSLNLDSNLLATLQGACSGMANFSVSMPEAQRPSLALCVNQASRHADQ